ncbi:acyl-CoA dehydrogenase family protein [Streptomyces sp. OfavH-34-F]|uniref:acyl-CoA dehydrogenase family protein n=1 Tax=Streptomyces sp. OfavH-34-F TaxID=2917760 RepID=UPI001EF165D3|nr:acyl-CoA dehydrogenase family protein [Streptomyces sp. OfavH-34-F]MCG7525528.1 acyl-CoA dehydrogenase family protein [Streptomyces sp. OfavH-34-F]
MPDVSVCRELGHRKGLAAGLAAVLEGLPLHQAAPGGLVAVPRRTAPADGVPVPLPLVHLEDIEVLRIAGPVGSGLTGTRAAALAAVRLGVLSNLLELAVERLSRREFAGAPILERQLVTGEIADLVTETEELTAALERADDGTPPAVSAAWHARLDELGWRVAMFFGAEGYITDHPARAVHVSALLADVCVARPVDSVGRPAPAAPQEAPC